MSPEKEKILEANMDAWRDRAQMAEARLAELQPLLARAPEAKAAFEKVVAERDRLKSQREPKGRTSSTSARHFRRLHKGLAGYHAL